MTQFVDNYIPSTQMGAHGVERSDYGGGIVHEVVGNEFGRNWIGLRRPFLDRHDRPRVSVLTGRYTVNKGERRPAREEVYVHDLPRFGLMPALAVNATSLRKEEWIELDRVVLRAARLRLRAWADLAASNSYGGFNAMGKMILEHETASDPGEAFSDMDGLTEGRTDSPTYQLEGLPLPITHSDFWFSSRRLAASRNTGMPLDTTMGEAAGRRVAEKVEKTTIGVETGLTYGGASTQQGGYSRTSSVYGYLNFPPRLTKTNMTAPTGGSWTPETTQIEVNVCLNTLRNQKFYGPFMLYHGNDWDPYLDGDYYVARTSGAVAPTKTLRERLRAIDGIQDVRRLDFLRSAATAAGDPADIQTANPFTFIFVQMTPDVARAVNGMDISTVQWESVGGMRLNFKVLAIQVPQLRADYYGNVGILQATTS